MFNSFIFSMDEINKQCPISKSKFRSAKPPFINNDLLIQMRDRDYFYKKAKKTKRSDDWNIAKFLRNQTNKNIRKAKARFIITELTNSKGNASKFWRTIKQVFQSKSPKKFPHIKLKVANKEIDPREVASHINLYFVNVGNIQVNHPSPNSLHPQ